MTEQHFANAVCAAYNGNRVTPAPAAEAVRRRVRARWERRRAETAEPLQLHAIVPGIGWAVPVHTTDAAHVLEHGRLDLLVSRPAPGSYPAPIKL